MKPCKMILTPIGAKCECGEWLGATCSNEENAGQFGARAMGEFYRHREAALDGGIQGGLWGPVEETAAPGGLF